MTVGADTSMRDAALEYARAGWAVLPLDASHAPLEHEPTTDENTLVRWWARYPEAMPGVALGRPIGGSRQHLVALIDSVTTASADYLEKRGALASLGHLVHGNDRAWLYASPEALASRELAPGLVVKGEGVIALPPAHDRAGEWRWRKRQFLPDRPLAAAPHWLRVAEPQPAGVDHPVVAADWGRELRRSEKGNVMPTLANASLILRCDDRWGGRLAYDEMAMSVAYDGAPMRDAHVAAMREAIERTYLTAMADSVVRDALTNVADTRRYHPVRSYLASLRWDGIARIARVLEEVLRIPSPTALDHAMLRCWFISAVARPTKPGCKVDTALVLVGKQGTFKSTFFRVLSEPWFSDSYMDITNKDSLMQLASAWIYEWSEIESVTNSRQAGEIKKFVTSQSDTFRAPFARTVQRAPRSGVIVGTTNEDRFLNDETGSRRFWVLRVPEIVNRSLLERWRDQLWAEAAAALAKEESWWLERSEETTREERAEEFSVIDPWTERLTNWIDQNGAEDYTAIELMSQALQLPARDQHSGNARRIGRTMRDLGFSRSKARPVREGRTLPPSWVWRRDAEASEIDTS